ncbi:MAG: PEP-CTERM sorting domain-containing protein [Gemmatimonadales bacterium]|nr:PEP-CTERM sorting domain-containing protein [Gemmatimonadales bacterium]
MPFLSARLRTLASALGAASLLLTSDVSAQTLAHFQLSCVNCRTGGTFSRSWVTPFAATNAPGFAESVPTLFFRIDVPETNGIFFAHSATYPGGYNYFDIGGAVNAAMAGPGASLIFDGPTSAPVWKVGVYHDVANYFIDGLDGGAVTLRITAVPEPGSLALSTVGLVGLGLVGRRRRA